MNKITLRKYAKNIRNSLDISTISRQIVGKIRQTPDYIGAQHVMIFYPTQFEINLLELACDDKHFYLPKIDGDNLLVCPFTPECNLVKSKFNTLEPQLEPVNKSIIDLVYIPALMVDKANHRLGYGGGFYDRFLKDFNAIKVVTISNKFVAEKLPTDDFDVPVDYFITD